MANNPLKKVALFYTQKKAIQWSGYIHTTAQMEAENIPALGFKSSICIIPNGIDLNDVKSVKEYYGTRKMVFLSRIHPKKGIELLLGAWRNSNTNGWLLEISSNGNENIFRVHRI